MRLENVTIEDGRVMVPAGEICDFRGCIFRRVWFVFEKPGNVAYGGLRFPEGSIVLNVVTVDCREDA